MTTQNNFNQSVNQIDCPVNHVGGDLNTGSNTTINVETIIINQQVQNCVSNAGEDFECDDRTAVEEMVFDEPTLVEINPSINVEINLFRRLLDAAPSFAMKTIVIFLLISLLPKVSELGIAEPRGLAVDCLDKNEGHSDSYHQAQLERATTSVLSMVEKGEFDLSFVNNSQLVVNNNGTVDLVSYEGEIIKLVDYYNSIDGEFLERSPFTICK